MTVGEWLQSTRGRLSSAGIESAALESQLLAAHVLLTDRVWILAHSNEPFPELAGESLVARRLAHEPLAYILGWREFYGRRFTVSRGVLIPRQDTEVLVEAAMAIAGSDSRILDLGTGSGCIAITLKLELPSLSVTASDISEVSLEIARRNATDLHATIDFILSDRFENLSDRSFDLIVSNPPYIGELEPLPQEVIDFEPRGALISGPTGLEFYGRLAEEAFHYLRPGGLLLMEVGYLQAADVEGLFKDRHWRHRDTLRDLSGTARVVVVDRG